MKSLTLSALTALLTLTAATAQEPVPPAVKDGYVKVRVEVEVRGLLKVTDKAAVVFTRYRYFDQRDPAKERPDVAGVPPYEVPLDFARAPDLRDLAKALDGKEVVVTGLSELRHVVPPPPPPGGVGGSGFGPPGGFGFYQLPSWHLQPGVLVTGLKLVPAKR
jgi:hypothetical protein